MAFHSHGHALHLPSDFLLSVKQCELQLGTILRCDEGRRVHLWRPLEAGLLLSRSCDMHRNLHRAAMHRAEQIKAPGRWRRPGAFRRQRSSCKDCKRRQAELAAADAQP